MEGGGATDVHSTAKSVKWRRQLVGGAAASPAAVSPAHSSETGAASDGEVSDASSAARRLVGLFSRFTNERPLHMRHPMLLFARAHMLRCALACSATLLLLLHPFPSSKLTLHMLPPLSSISQCVAACSWRWPSALASELHLGALEHGMGAQGRRRATRGRRVRRQRRRRRRLGGPSDVVTGAASPKRRQQQQRHLHQRPRAATNSSAVGGCRFATNAAPHREARCGARAQRQRQQHWWWWWWWWWWRQ
jgi:hypothetical protein